MLHQRQPPEPMHVRLDLKPARPRTLGRAVEEPVQEQDAPVFGGFAVPETVDLYNEVAGRGELC